MGEICSTLEFIKRLKLSKCIVVVALFSRRARILDKARRTGGGGGAKNAFYGSVKREEEGGESSCIIVPTAIPTNFGRRRRRRRRGRICVMCGTCREERSSELWHHVVSIATYSLFFGISVAFNFLSLLFLFLDRNDNNFVVMTPPRGVDYSPGHLCHVSQRYYPVHVTGGQGSRQHFFKVRSWRRRRRRRRRSQDFEIGKGANDAR